MKLTWYGHSCFLLETAEGSLVFDPYAPGEVPGLRLPALRADKVICSHAHSDHNDSRAVTLSGRDFNGEIKSISSFHDGSGGRLRGENKITLVEAVGLRIAHLGDLGHLLNDRQLASLGRIDLLMIPVGGFYTIDARTAKELTDALNPAVTVPMHYRGAGFGFGEIAPAEAYLRLRNDVKYFDTNTLELNAIPARPFTAVLKCPAEI